jgi:HD-like signal output (HDOD) protein
MQTFQSINHELEQTVINLGIPPCPKILLDLSIEGRKDEPDFQRIEQLISADVGLSAALIKTINSPFYGLRNKVSSIAQAIHMLGLKHLSLMMRGLVLRDALNGMNHVDMARFLDASTHIAVISSYIACRLPYLDSSDERRPQIDQDEAYTFGLFQDCGIPIMLNHYPQYKEALKIANQSSGIIFTDVEDIKYGKNHATIGYRLAKSWGLPDAITEAIRYHHEHEALAHNKELLSIESRNFIALSLLAERAIQIINGQSLTCEWHKGGPWVMQHFGLTEYDFNSIIKGIRILNEEGNLNV